VSRAPRGGVSSGWINHDGCVDIQDSKRDDPMKQRIALALVFTGALLLPTAALQAQESLGRVFDPQVNPTDSDIIAFERAFEGQRTLTFMSVSTRRMQSVGGTEVGDADLFDLGAQISDGEVYSGELSWGPRDEQGRQWFAYVSGKDGGGLGLYVDHLDARGNLAGDPGLLDYDGPVSSPRFAPNGRHLLFASGGRSS
jgi:hypothetical protein